MTQAGPGITGIIRERFSCRSYAGSPIDEQRQRSLRELMQSISAGPLSGAVRFTLVAPSEEDRTALRGLGTYGFIRGTAGFIVGAVRAGDNDLLEYGYSLERMVLAATGMKLGTCWLGGTFTRSSFARAVSLERTERLPAVAAVGLVADTRQARNTPIRRIIGSDNRLPWQELFRDGGFDSPLSREDAGPYAAVLDMVRLAPSASNRQPWRILRSGSAWHFYLRRTHRSNGRLASRIFHGNDIQRVDIGIAMCHFALTAHKAGLTGLWVRQDPGIRTPDHLTEYVISWTA